MYQNMKCGRSESSQFTTLKFSAILCCLLALYFTTIVKDWRFFDDDYGAIHIASITKNSADFGAFFSSKHNEQTVLPTNLLEIYKPSFSTTTFRPLTLAWYCLVCKVLDPQKPQHFFLFSIFLHILATLLLFLAFQNYLSTPLAFFAALLFGIFPFHGRDLGRLVIESYSLSLILNIVGYFCIQRYLSRCKSSYYVLAIICFALSLLLHEANYSYILLYYILFFTAKTKNSNSRLQVITSSFSYTAPFLITLLSCLLAKYAAYPQCDVGTFFKTFLCNLKFRFYDFVTLIMNILGYSPIPGGNTFLKSSLLLIDCCSFSLLFFYGGNTTALISLGLFTIQAWPSILSNLSRYLYFSMPYFILALFVMYSQLHNSKLENILKKVLQAKYFLITILGLITIRTDLLRLEQRFVFADNAIKTFSSKLKNTRNKTSLCFAGVPLDYFAVSGLAQAIWFYTGNNNIKIFYDILHGVQFAKKAFLPNKNFCHVEFDEKNKILRIHVDKSTTAYIRTHDAFGGKQLPCSTGTVICKETGNANSNNKTQKVTIHLDEKLFPIKLVVWDQETGSFRFLHQ